MNTTNTTNTTIEDHATMAPAPDVLRYLLGRPATQARVMESIGDRVALRRLRESGLIISCQSLLASVFKVAEERCEWKALALAMRDDMDSDPDRATMGFVQHDPAVVRVLLGFPGDLIDPLTLLDK